MNPGGNNGVAAGPDGGGSNGIGLGGTTFANPAVQQMGMDYGAKFLGQSHDLVNSRVNTFMASLKPYFDVNVSYVAHKLRCLLFPFPPVHRSWHREVFHHHGAHDPNANPGSQVDQRRFAPPREDVNAPDLYVPLMAFVTHVLVVAFLMGTGNAFHPEVLGIVASTGFAVLALEVFAIKLGLYIFSSPSANLANPDTPSAGRGGAYNVPVAEVLSLCGYKYVAVTVSMLLGVLLGSTGYYAGSVVLGGFAGFVMLKTLGSSTAEDVSYDYDPQGAGASLGGGGGGGGTRKRVFLTACACLQVPLVLFLGYARLLQVDSAQGQQVVGAGIAQPVGAGSA